MDMNPSNPSASSGGGGDMEGWKPYLHTSLFSPGAFSNSPDAGEAFLFPSFRIYSRTTFLLACLFTFSLALCERYLSFLLDSTFSLNPTSSRGMAGGKRKNSNSTSTAEGSNVYISIPATVGATAARARGAKIRLVVRTAVYFSATLLRYVLMIIGMGMDWFLLLSLVSGLTLGHFLTDLYKLSSSSAIDIAMERGVEEEVELLPHSDDREEAKAEGQGGEWLHRRSSSRQDVTPY